MQLLVFWMEFDLNWNGFVFDRRVVFEILNMESEKTCDLGFVVGFDQ